MWGTSLLAVVLGSRLPGAGTVQLDQTLAFVAPVHRGDRVVVRELPVVFYTRTPEYVRGARGEISALAYESPAPEDETWDRPDAKTEWFYVVKFNMSELWDGYTGPSIDALRTEIPEHWLDSAI
jgi:hypothetical protein